MKYLLLLLFLAACEEPSTLFPIDMKMKTQCEKEIDSFLAAKDSVFNDPKLVPCSEGNPHIRTKTSDDFTCNGSLVRRDYAPIDSLIVDTDAKTNTVFGVFGEHPTLTKCVHDRFTAMIHCPITYKYYYCKF